MKGSHQVRSAKTQPGHHLCNICKKLHLEVFFSHKTSQQSIGKISQYADPDCPFCSLISRVIDRAWGSDERDKAGRCELLIESRSPLSVKEHGHIRHPQPRLVLATNQEPPKFHHNKTPPRKVDREKTGFIIAEIESIPINKSDISYLPRRKIGKYVDISLVEDWLDKCRKHRHSKASIGQDVHGLLFQPQFPFRLIDVNRECIVEKDRRCAYVTLSYVWGDLPTLYHGGKSRSKGKIPILMTLKDNIKDLKIERSLSESRLESPSTGRIPQTVRDAMEFTQQIGIRYLWVDTLCIIQDDEEDRKRLISQMGDIYNSATVTVIAAAGSNADAGLSGISPRVGHSIRGVKIAGDSGRTVLNLSISLSSLCEEVRMSTWNTRGWTFQEQSLSQRCLYFTANEVFFNCSECQRREGYDYVEKRKTTTGEVKIKARTGPPWWNTNIRYDLEPTPYNYLGDMGDGKLDPQSYELAVQEYSRKNLRDPCDVFNAFEGIFNRFQRSKNAPSETLDISQAQAIPSSLLYRSMLWFPLPGAEKRQLSNPMKLGIIRLRKKTGQLSLRSWSWTSWSGPVEFVFEDNLWLPRKISRVPIKRVPLYVPIVCWYYGGSEISYFWTRDIWRTAYISSHSDTTTSHTDSEVTRTRKYLQSRVGINVKVLLDESTQCDVPGDTLESGELGFFAPYVVAEQFHIKIKPGDVVGSLDVSGHRGEFRFDGGYEPIDELVPIVVADTLSKPPNAQSILLGLTTTRKGVSKRVGIGFVHYSDVDLPKPQWNYRFFMVR
ncbi:HET-domain-containing protein [Annulohypoxylon maeteangense]|uniref:HET-domain-containing protein n=1 Tax=Annulohypoxylon maeteangense TaxID=1927788 RepID=UPI002007EA43|nr:HET-domain-containing protein [Annulohypoxylon maeteangense]KAI0884919.1 HET-domain-containing protein [Annulohypoxylon maeteangense]